jgi:acetate kinase
MAPEYATASATILDGQILSIRALARGATLQAPMAPAIAGKRILTLNAGSSSLKLALFEAAVPPRRLLGHAVTRIDPKPTDFAKSLDLALASIDSEGGLETIAAVGHRVVHGGPHYATSQLLTSEVTAALRRLAALDPDHLPAEIALIEAMRTRAPSLPQVACFDTAFHMTMPRVARLLPIPLRYEREGVQRYGFHGLSYTFLCEELERVAAAPRERARVVLAHLGSGASLAAVHEGRCVDTTMGFTPNSGIPMSTRSGDMDPGVLIHLLRTEHLDADALDVLLSRRSGLLGVSETSLDMRDLLARRGTDPRASDAVMLFCHHVRKAIGALTTSLGGVDTLVFSGGIGENAAPVRAEILQGLEHLGMYLDPARNDAAGPVISADGSACTVRVIRTDEESIIARETVRVSGGAP